MVDRVELVVLDHPQEVRELEGAGAVALQQHLEAGDEIEDVGHVCEDVVGRHQVGAVSLREQPLGGSAAEERDLARHALLARHGRDVGRGSTPSTGTPRATKYCSR